MLFEAKCATEDAGICLFMAVPRGLTKSSSDNFLLGFALFTFIAGIFFDFPESLSDFFDALLVLLILLTFDIVLKFDMVSSLMLSFLSESSWDASVLSGVSV